MDGPPENDVCSICHASFHIPCQANCSHWFCGGCILQLWDHGAALHPGKCPLCRREITLLVPSEASLRRHHVADDRIAEILQRIQRYNRLHGEHLNDLMQRMQDLPFLLKRLLWDISDPQRSLPFVMRAHIYLAVKFSLSIKEYDVDILVLCNQIAVSFMYVLSPVGFIPEALLGIFDLLDNLIIVFACFLHVAALLSSCSPYQPWRCLGW